MRLKVEASGLAPEEVLVLETAGPVEDFIVAVRHTKGMEWLAEIEDDCIPPDDDFFSLNKKGEALPGKTLRGRVFLVFTNQRALHELLSLWERWCHGQPFARGKTKWSDVFAQLRDIRPWDVRDRLIETHALEDWEDSIENGAESIRCEIELWFRQESTSREAARKRVSKLVAAEGGRVLGQSVIPEIAYHAMLAELPKAAVQRVQESAGTDVALVLCEQVQFFRATGQMATSMPDGEVGHDTASLPPSQPVGTPVAALLDGLPLENHRRLVGWLRVDDPDDLGRLYQAEERRHGTAMASLILHGDLNAMAAAPARSLYVRPILRPNVRDWRRHEESAPENVLFVDLLHRAVRRLHVGEGDQPPAAPSVRVVNLSIGIRDRLFDGALTPLARLLDWLAWEHKLLFVVSAGNHHRLIETRVRLADFAGLRPEQVEEEVIKVIAADMRNRRLLSPAEAVNVLTVGALHEDQAPGPPVPRAIDPFCSPKLPSPNNALGMGFRRGIKPEVLAPGGRVVLQERLLSGPNAAFEPYCGTRAPGQLVACPGTSPGDLSATWYTRGTSGAAAMVTRAATLLYDVLQDLRLQPGGEVIDAVPAAIWLKALLVHSAEWGDAGPVLEGILRTQDNSKQFKEYITRLLGYGGTNPARSSECTEYRVTALGGGSLAADKAHVHQFPLPPSLSGVRGWRRLTVTLAWLTPINPLHQAWRRADLWFNPLDHPLRVDRQQADWQAVQRGTVQHEVFKGVRASAFTDGESIGIQVNCKAGAGTLEQSVPYALAVSLEVGEEIAIPIYDEVRVRIQAARVRVQPDQ
ncbi:MAG TPA: S8 family peptidase [Planctomycetota bacterium]|nr:S8 family peptidase [Planctomycetota bacterium]